MVIVNMVGGSKGELVSVAKEPSGPLTGGRKYLLIQLLTGQRLALVVDVRAKVDDLFQFACRVVGMEDRRLFGLATAVDKEFRFLDSNEKITKYTPKGWKTVLDKGLDASVVVFHLRVLVYVDYVRLISDPLSLHHYYLQLRENVRVFWDSPTSGAEGRVFEACAYAMQADFGDFNKHQHKADYFRPELYFPLSIINACGLDYITRHMPGMHNDLAGLDRTEAIYRFCREMSQPPSMNLHLYGLRKQKGDMNDSVFLGICARGLEIYELQRDMERTLVARLPWSRIGKLFFERKKFSLNSLDGQKFVFFTPSDEKSRYLLELCKSIHKNLIKLHADINNAKLQEEQERRITNFRESYIYSDKSELEWMQRHGHIPYCYRIPTTIDASHTENHIGQRVSVVSDSSSNTTSGIVSDKQQTHDDSEMEDFDADQALIDGSPLVSELSLSSMSARDSLSFHLHDGPGTSISLGCTFGVSVDNVNGVSQQRDSEVTTMSTVTDSDTLNCSSSHSGSFRKISTGSAISAFQQTDETSDRWRDEDDSGNATADSIQALNESRKPTVTVVNVNSHSRSNSLEVDLSQRTPRSSRPVNIAEIRERTLHGYSSPKVVHKSAQLPVVAVPVEGVEPKVMKSLTTQTSNDHYQRQESGIETPEEFQEGPCVVSVSSPSKYLVKNESKSLSDLYRIVSASSSNNLVSMTPMVKQLMVDARPESAQPDQYVFATVPNAQPSDIVFRPAQRQQQVVPSMTQSHSASSLPGAVHNGYIAAPLAQVGFPTLDPPNYDQVMQMRAEKLNFHVNRSKTEKRWTSVVNGVPEAILAQLMPDLQQSTSDPALSAGFNESFNAVQNSNVAAHHNNFNGVEDLSGPYAMSALQKHLDAQGMCLCGTNLLCSIHSAASSQHQFNVANGRSVAAQQQQNSGNPYVKNVHARPGSMYLPPHYHVQPQQQRPSPPQQQFGNFPDQAVPNSPSVSRTQSLPEHAAKTQQLKLRLQELQRLNQLQTGRAKAPEQYEPAAACNVPQSQTNAECHYATPNVSNASGSNKHFCEGCYEQHSVRRLDLAEIKSLTEQLDLPFVKALLLDKANQPASIRSHTSSIGSTNGRCLSHFLQVAKEQQQQQVDPVPVAQQQRPPQQQEPQLISNNQPIPRRPASFHESHFNLLGGGAEQQFYYDLMQQNQQYSPALRLGNSPAAQGFYEPSNGGQHQPITSPNFAISPSFLQQSQPTVPWSNGQFFPNGGVIDYNANGVRTFYNGPLGPQNGMVQPQLPTQARYASTPNLIGENHMIAAPPPYLCRVGQYNPAAFSAGRVAYDGVR